MKKRFGFTLAEVLITLGIIGVVAAMTIPTLIQNTNGNKFLSQYKKTLSTLSQAGLMATANYDIDYSGAREGCTDPKTDVLGSQRSICAILNSTLAGVHNIGDLGDVDGVDTNTKYSITRHALGSTKFTLYSLADGAIIGVNKEATGCSLAPGGLSATGLKNAVASAAATSTTAAVAAESAGDLNKCVGFIDVNGIKLPNEEIACSNVSDTAYGADPCPIASGADIGDVFPVIFHNGTVEPATNAARAALINQKR